MTKNKTSVTLKLVVASELDKRIASLHKAGQSLQKDMHLLACSVLATFGETKDARIAEAFVMKLVQAMPEMARTNALKAWFEAHAPIKFATPEEIKAGASSVRYVKGGAFKLGDAMATPFWKFQPEKPYEPLNMSKYIESVIAKITKDAKATGADHSAVLMALKTVAVPDASKLPKATNIDAITGLPN